MKVRGVVIAHIMLSMSAVAAITVLTVLRDVSATTAVIVILAATGIGSSSNSTLQALVNAKDMVETATTTQSTSTTTPKGDA